MNLFDVLRPECIATGVSLSDKPAVIAEIARLAKCSDILKDFEEQKINDMLTHREQMTSTGVGDGFAIPHCQLPGLEEYVVGILVAPDGVDYDAHDGEKVFEFVFVIGPEDDRRGHLRLLSAISQILMIPEARREIRAAGTPEILHETCLMYARDELDATGHTGMDIVHVFIENENYFREILQVFEAMESASVTVVESKDPVEYLRKMPLFAGFWHDKAAPFNRIVIAVIDKRLANDTLRRIQRITGKIDDRKDIMVTIQELMYANGILAT